MSEREDMIRRLDKMELRPRASRQEVLEAVQAMGVKMHLIKTCSECGWEMEQIEIEANEENELVWQCSECGRIEESV